MALSRDMLPKLYAALEVLDGQPLDMGKHREDIRVALASLGLRHDEVEDLMGRIRARLASLDDDHSSDDTSSTSSSQDDIERTKAKVEETRKVFFRVVLEGLLDIDEKRREEEKKGKKRSKEREAAEALVMSKEEEQQEEDVILSLTSLQAASPPSSPPRVSSSEARFTSWPPPRSAAPKQPQIRSKRQRLLPGPKVDEESEQFQLYERPRERSRKKREVFDSDGDRYDRKASASVFDERDDKLILRALASRGGETPNWKRIAQHELKGRFTAGQVAQHYRRVLEPRQRGFGEGTWSPKEEKLLLERRADCIRSMWRDVSRHVRTRSDVQCRYWWGVIKRCEALEWRDEEDVCLRRAVEHYNSIPDDEVKCEDWELLTRIFGRKCNEGRKGGFSQPRTPYNLVLRCNHLGLLCKERPEGSGWLPTSSEPEKLEASLAQEDEVEIKADLKPRPLSEVELEIEMKPAVVATNGVGQGKQGESHAQTPVASFAPPVVE